MLQNQPKDCQVPKSNANAQYQQPTRRPRPPDTHAPANQIRQNQHTPPHGMSGLAANASGRAQYPHSPYANRDQNKDPRPVGEQMTFALAEKGAERNDQAARKDNDRTLHGINGSHHHANTAKNYE